MNIAVISPHHNSTGNTTIASLLALELSTKSSKVCITHSLPKSESITTYFGLGETKDKTINPARLVKMLRSEAIKMEEVSDYCRALSDRVDLFSADTDTFTEEDMNYALGYITTIFPHDYIVYDVDSKELECESNRKILENADVAIIVINQSITELQEFKRRVNKIMLAIGKIPMFVVVNKYCEIQGSIKETAAMMGVKAPKNWSVVRYNPWVTYGTNKGKLGYIYEQMKANDYRVADLASDIKNLANLVQKVKIAKRQLNKENIQRRIEAKVVQAEQDTGGDTE